MYAMQYEITLPSDYDMNLIRGHVKDRLTAFDHFKGLGLKAFLIQEHGVHNAAVNQYAPFYLWSSVDGMGNFIWRGGGLSGIIEAFGRPSIHHWTGVSFRQGPAVLEMPSVAVRHVQSLPPNVDPKHAVHDAVNSLRHRAQQPNVHSGAVAIDPKSWELTEFTLLMEAIPELPGTQYQVLHLSCPHINDLDI